MDYFDEIEIRCGCSLCGGVPLLCKSMASSVDIFVGGVGSVTLTRNVSLPTESPADTQQHRVDTIVVST